MNVRKSLGVLFGLLLVAFVATGPVAAQEKKEAGKAEITKKEPPQRVSEAQYIHDLAVNGRELKDPYLLIEAAQLAITAGKLPGPKRQVSEPEAAAAQKKVDLDPASLLKEAAQMAGGQGDRKAIEMAADIARNPITGLGKDDLATEISNTTVARGFRAAGSLRDSGCLYPGQSADYNINFNGGQDAGVGVYASPPVDLFLFAGSQLIGGEDSYAQKKALAWHVTSGGFLTIRVKANYGYTCYSIYIP
jgi:hypothetical protein